MIFLPILYLKFSYLINTIQINQRMHQAQGIQFERSLLYGQILLLCPSDQTTATAQFPFSYTLEGYTYGSIYSFLIRLAPENSSMQAAHLQSCLNVKGLIFFFLPSVSMITFLYPVLQYAYIFSTGFQTSLITLSQS